MRLLTQHNVAYKSYEYTEIAQLKISSPIYKTLVTIGKSKEHYVFVVPIQHELDLKKAAKAVSEKSIHMIPQKALLPLTGYVHGGCSPIGMKKLFVTTIDQSALSYPRIVFNAGRVHEAIEIEPRDLEKIIPVQFVDISTEMELK